MAGGSHASFTVGTPSQQDGISLLHMIHHHPRSHQGLVRRKSHQPPPDKYDEENDPIPDDQEEGPAPVKFRHVIEGLFHHSSNHDHHHHDHSQIDIEHYIHDKSFRRRLFLLSLSNSDLGIRVQLFRALMFVLGCVLYVIEASYYDYWGDRINLSEFNSTAEIEARKLLYIIIYTDKPYALWVLQVLVATITMFGASVGLYTRVVDLSCRGLMKELSYTVFIQLFIGVLYLVTLVYPPLLKNLFVPMFLLCWPGRHALSAAIIQSASKQLGVGPKTFVIRAIHLAVFLICFTYTWVCILHRVELVNSQLHFFDTIWFVLVTLSSVGYGDISPEHYTSKFLVMLFIILGFVVILPQLEELYHTFLLQRQLHNSVSYKDSHKHVILCSSELKPMVLRDFLTEFFSDPKNIDIHCVVLVEKELSPFIRVYLSHPVWSSRITILIGSPMRRNDLARARIDTATACFIHTSRSSEEDPETADQHTVISAWAVKNFAPQCKLYVHILKPETRMHLDLADQVMCEGEVKLALMANHVNCPGISTLVTLLLHTFKSEYHNLSGQDYRLYDRCSSCEVYDSRVGDSKYFHFFVGKNFLYASVVAYRRYQVTLLGVKPKDSRDILLNPGLHYILEEDDVCYYIGFTREEYSKVREAPPSKVRTAMWQTCANVALLSLHLTGIGVDQLGVELGPEPPGEEKNKNWGNGGGEVGGSGEVGEGGGIETVPSIPSGMGEKKEVERVPSSDGQSNNVHFIVGSGATLKEDGSEHISSGVASKEPSFAGDHQLPSKGCLVTNRESANSELSSADNKCKRGLKLLQFHSKIDIHANPVVKVHFCPPTPAITPEEEEEEEEEDEENVFEMHAPPVSEKVRLMEEGRGYAMNPIGVGTPTSRRRGRRSLKRSISESSLTGIMTDQSNLKNHGIIYSSQLSLVKELRSRVEETYMAGRGSHTRLHHTPLSHPQMGHTPLGNPPLSHTHLSPPSQSHHVFAKVFRRMSSWGGHHRQSIPSSVDFKGSQEVVLDLEDVEEERELEELEDGRCGGDEEEEESDDEVTEQTDFHQPDSQTTPSNHHHHKYVKGSLPRVPYCGCGTERFHLLPERRPHHILHIDNEPSEVSENAPEKEEVVEDVEEEKEEVEEKVSVSHRWKKGGVIVYSEEGTAELYNLILPLRAHYLHTAELKHILLLLGKQPSPSFLDLISQLPLVHYMTGDIGDLDTWLRAGVLVSECVIITGGRRPHHDQEHMVDAKHIMAAQKISKLFPKVNVMTELHYRYNMRFLQPDNYVLSGGDNRRDHLSYLFQPQFAGGRTFCASMLDTLLYQSHVKSYIIDLVRQLLGCQQVNDSAYLWKLEIGEELLALQTYDRLFQKVVTVHHCVPLGLYRTVPLPSCPVFQKYYSERTALYADTRYIAYLKSRLEMMGEEVEGDMMNLLEESQILQSQSFVLVNPPHKTHLQEGDILLTLRPHHPPSHTNHPLTHFPPPPPPPPPPSPPPQPAHVSQSNPDNDSGLHYSSPPTLSSSPPSLPSTPNTIIVTAECH